MIGEPDVDMLLAENERLERFAVRANAEIDRLRAEVAARQEIVDDLRALVAEADREPGGMRVPWLHDLAGAVRMPSVVRWARGVLRRCEEPRR